MDSSKSAIANGFCIRPTELSTVKVHVGSEGKASYAGSGELVAKPGAVLSTSLVICLPSGVFPMDVGWGMTRNTAQKLYDMLGAFLNDAGHYHWVYGTEMERQTDENIQLDESKIQFDIPDTLDGLDVV